jgi:hypothetical protein
MSLRISGIPSTSPDLGSKRLGKAVFQKKQNASTGVLLKKATKSSEQANTRPPDQFRYELSNLNEQSVGLQREISSQQTILGGLAKLEDEIKPIAENPENAELVRSSLERASKILKTSKFEGREVLTSSPHKSSNPNIEPVTISDPPKIGTYSVSILGKVDNSSLSFTLDVSDMLNQKRRITTAFSPATGIIEGVELYFEEIEGQAKADISIKDTEKSGFAIPDFTQSLSRIKERSSSPEQLGREADQSLRKIQTTRNGVESSLKQKTVEFQAIATARENIKASDSDSLTVSTAKDTLSKLNSKIVEEPISLSSLFKISDSDTAKDLLD